MKETSESHSISRLKRGRLGLSGPACLSARLCME